MSVPQWPIPYDLQSEVQRVLGFPATLSSASIQLGYPEYASELSIYQPYAILQNKLLFLTSAPVEAVQCFGARHPSFMSYLLTASALLTLTTPSSIAAGATLNLLIAGALAATVVAGGSDTPTTMTTELVAQLAGNPSVLPAASGPATTLYAATPGNSGNGIPLLAVSSDPSLLINGVQGLSSGTQGGSDPPGPVLMDESLSQPIYGFLPIILRLETDIAAVRTRLSADQAGDVKPRQTELAERDALLRNYRRRFADFLGVPFDPDIVGNRRGGSVRRVV